MTSGAPASISVFFPAYNDGGTIASMVINAMQTLRALTDDYEVIVVHNGSTDFTAQVLDELKLLYPDTLRVLDYPHPLGYGGALRVGFASCTKSLIFYTDGDAQYDPRELAVLYSELRPGVDMVNGYKMGRSDPLYRVVIGRAYHWGVKTLFGLRLRDVDCDFRLMRREVFDRVVLKSRTGVICVELMKKVQDGGFTIAEVPVHHYHRAYGGSQFFNVPRIHRTLRALLELWWDLVALKKLGRAPDASAAPSLGLSETADHRAAPASPAEKP
ncbi:MAG: glycosyltransferase family 2 protein [Dehalococcoidia bacterium]|nr:glycosyltransferase family 2 protein [Dehalococcoidia bacterium]